MFWDQMRDRPAMINALGNLNADWERYLGTQGLQCKFHKILKFFLIVKIRVDFED